MSIAIDRGRPTAPAPHTSSSLTVRVWVDGGRVGVAVGAPEDRESLVASALAQAATASPNPHAGPVARIGEIPRGLAIDDRRHAQITTQDRVEALLAAEKGAHDRRVRVGTFGYRDERRRRRYANTRGVQVEEWSTTYAMTGSVTIGDSEPVTIADAPASRAFSTIASLPFGADLLRRAALLAPSTATVEGPIRVALAARPVAELLARLAPAFRDLADGEGFLAEAYRSGARVVDPRINLLDDGTLPGGLRTHAFDDRGVPPVPVALLTDGRAPSRWIDLVEARRRGVRPTGHFYDGALRANNLVLRGGARSTNAILSESDVPAFVVEHVRDWSGFDPVRGTLRIPVTGFLTRRAKRDGGARHATLEGRLPEVLSRVVEVTSDADRFGSIDACALLADGFTATR